MNRNVLGLTGVLIVVLAYALLKPPKGGDGEIFPFTPYSELTLISHAGGGLDVGMYSNSREAMDMAAQNGFRLIEVDLTPTRSGGLVLLHDWGPRYEAFFDVGLFARAWSKIKPRQSQDVAEFKSKSMKYGLTAMGAEDLRIWMTAHPTIKIITDIKSDNVTHLTKMKDEFGPLVTRIIPQIYDPRNYAAVKALGYQDIIFTNYKALLAPDDLINFAEGHRLFALTIPLEMAQPNLFANAAKLNLPVFGHRFSDETPWSQVNTIEGAEELRALGFDGIYTDYLYAQSER